MVVMDVPNENSDVDLKEVLTKPNHLLLQDTSIDNILEKLIDDCSFKQEIDKIEAMLDLPNDQYNEPSNDSNSSKRKSETTQNTSNIEESKG